jgi:hypothetical protein
MVLNKTDMEGFVELVFGPRWTYISAVRNFLQKFLFVTLENSKSADIISMCASEMLENSIKYASEEGTKITVKYNKNADQLTLSVENFSSPSNIEVLLKQIAIVNAGTPEEMYLNKMQEAAARNDGGSQLGLARIRYETNASIGCEINKDLVKILITFDLKYTRR